MSKPIKGSLQNIISTTLIPSTSGNRRVNGGGQMQLKLACGHTKLIRASAMNKRPNRPSTPKKAQCWECVAEKALEFPEDHHDYK